MADPSKLRKLAAWYRVFAERAANPMIWDARLRTAEDLDKEASHLEQLEAVAPHSHPSHQRRGSKTDCERQRRNGARVRAPLDTGPAPMDNTQSEVVAFLCNPASYPHDAGKIDLIRTHISFVFLAGRYVYKLKRAVKYPYLDFSTVQLRRAACGAELELNRRTAPELYLEVRAIIRGSTAGFVGATLTGGRKNWSTLWS